MATGLMVLGSRVSGVKDVLKAFDDCLFEPSDVEALKQKLRATQNVSSEERHKLGAAMQAYVLEHFSKTDFISRHESLYKQMIG